MTRALAIVLLVAHSADAQTAGRRLATIDALRQFPGFYHLQNVVLRGELVESSGRLVLRADDHEMRVVLNDGVRSDDGAVEVRGQLIDVGRLEPGDPRVGPLREGRDAERWPRPGEELFLQIGRVSEAALATTPNVRSLALE